MKYQKTKFKNLRIYEGVSLMITEDILEKFLKTDFSKKK